MAFYKPRILQGSYSRIKDYFKCPRLAMYKHIHKIKEPESPPMLRGKELHSQSEQYVKAGDPQANPPPALWNVQENMREYAKLVDPQLELQLAVTKEWTKTGWFDKDVYLRAVFDLVCIQGTHGFLVDHKTGKVYDDHPDQATIYAAFGFAIWPELETIKVQFNYIDQGMDMDYDFTREEHEGLKSKWDEKMATVSADEEFLPKPGRGCRWCNFRAEKGGPCEFGA